jgi:hypothetical protein
MDMSEPDFTALPPFLFLAARLEHDPEKQRPAFPKDHERM